MLFTSWNHNLTAILHATRTQPLPHLDKNLKTAARLTISRGKAAEVTAFNIDQAISFHFLVSALPNYCVRPAQKAESIVLLTKHLRKFLVLYVATISVHKEGFFGNLRNLASAVSSEVLLYIYINLGTKIFAKWIRSFKKQLLKLTYEVVTTRFSPPASTEVTAWVRHWVRLGVLSADKELRPLLGISLALDKDETETTSGLSIIPDEKTKEGQEIYTGEYSEICQHFIRFLSAKKEKQIGDYISVFYELLLQLRPTERPAQYFESQLDHSNFRKSYVYSMVEYFIMCLGQIDSYFGFVRLFDVVRLVAPILTEGNRKQLVQLAHKYAAGIDVFKYQPEAILACLENSFYGRCLIELEDEPLPPLSSAETPEPSLKATSVSPEEAAQIAREIFEDDVSIYSAEERIKFCVSGRKIASPADSTEKIMTWATAAPWTGPDDGKRLRKLMRILQQFGVIKPEAYGEFAKFVIKKTEKDYAGTRVISMKEFCVSENVAKHKLPDDGSVQDKGVLEGFAVENAEFVSMCMKKASDMAKSLYESEKPKGDAYRQLAKTTKRLTDALQKEAEYSGEEAKIRVVGSAANGLWTPNKSAVDYAVILENRLLDPPFPLPHLEKIASILQANEICDSAPIISAGHSYLSFDDKVTGLHCTLALNVPLEIPRSSLLLAYIKVDERFRLLAVFVKEWARKCHIFGGAYLSSYAYTLLVLHYLQVVSPPVLPCLQQIFLTKSEGATQILRHAKDGTSELLETNVYFESKTDKVWGYMKGLNPVGNTSKVGELLAGFFRYFGYEFDFGKLGISVREGRAREKLPEMSKDEVYVEDLFVKGKNVAAGVAVQELGLIRKLLRAAAIQVLQEPLKLLTEMK